MTQPETRRSNENENECSHSTIYSHKTVWAVIRDLGRFTISEIQQKAELERDTISEYVGRLLSAGYIDFDSENPGAAEIAYKLVKDVGPGAPMFRKDGLPIADDAPRTWGVDARPCWD